MRTRRVTVLTALLVLLLVLGTTGARASTPGLVEKWYFHNNDSLRARIAIEVNDAGQGRYRFHLTCYYTDDNGHTNTQYCDFDPHIATWCDLTTGSCVSGRPELVIHDNDHTWTGSVYRTLVNNHTYAAKMTGFLAYFYNSGHVGALHTICTKKVTWHSGGSPTVGGAWC